MNPPNSSPFFHFDPHCESVSEFVHRLKPSQTTSTACFWISIHNGSLLSFPSSFSNPPKSILEHLLHESSPILEKCKCRYIKAAQHRRPSLIEETKSKILSIASKFKITTGKWVLFFNESIVDVAWSKIALATHQGLLGSSAKVSPKAYQTSSSYLICIYTEDFNDVKETARVLHQLRRLFPSLIKTSIHYKPDVYTYLGLHSNNTYKIPSSLYKSTQFDNVNGLFIPSSEISSSTYLNKSTTLSTISSSSQFISPKPRITYITLEDKIKITPPTSPSKPLSSEPKKRSREPSHTSLLLFSSPPLSPTAASSLSSSNTNKKKKFEVN